MYTHALNLGFEPLTLVFLSSYLKVFYIYELCTETAATFNTLKTKNKQKLSKIPLDKSLLKNFVSAEHGFPARSPLGRLFSAQVARNPGCSGNPGARSVRRCAGAARGGAERGGAARAGRAWECARAAVPGGSRRAGGSFQFARRTPHPMAGSRLPEALPKFKQGASLGSHTPSQLLKSPLSSRLPGLFLPTLVPPAPPVECGTPGQPDLGGDGVTGFERVGARTDAGATRALEGRDRPSLPLCTPLQPQVSRSAAGGYGERRRRWAQGCAQVCALHVLVRSLEGRSAPTPRWASHVLGPRGGSAGAGHVSSEVQARGCSARGRTAGLVRDSNSRRTRLLRL